MRRSITVFAAAAVAAAALWGAPASATHAWGTYHWARTSNSFTLALGDNVTAAWDSYLGVASADWSTSKVLDTTVVTGTTSPKTCKPRSGRVEVCNASYGRNGWLGIAQIWASGGHITQGVVKLNDTYFNTAAYNTPAWRAMVTCQEVGHTFGLGHQDEAFDNPNLDTCMDYTSNPASNQHPNQHDYEMLESIYNHLESASASSASTTGPGNSQADWGRAVSKGGPHGHADQFEKDLGDGTKVITHVFWAEHDHSADHGH